MRPCRENTFSQSARSSLYASPVAFNSSVNSHTQSALNLKHVDTGVCVPPAGHLPSLLKSSTYFFALKQRL